MKKLNKNIILEKLKESKDELTNTFGLKSIGLYGSYAVGKQKNNSDIDLMFELNKGADLNFEKLVLLEEYLKKILNFKKIELVNSKFMNPIVKHNSAKSIIYV